MELLLFHSFSHPDIDHPKMETGFLKSLRPCQGHRNEQNFHEIMEAIRVLAPSFQQPTVDQEVVCSIWTVCELARAWGIHPDGMLQRNHLIKTEDVKLLADWIGCISFATMILLDKGGLDVAFEEYNQLKKD